MTATSSTKQIDIPDLALGQKLFAKWQAQDYDQEAAFAASNAPYTELQADQSNIDAADVDVDADVDGYYEYEDGYDDESGDVTPAITEESIAAAFSHGNTALANLTDYAELEQDLKPFITALYHAEADLIGDRYVKFTHDDNIRFIAMDKLIFANGLNTGNTKEQMMLEFLLVLASQYQQEPFAEVQKDEFGRVCFIKRRQLLLRRILFNNPFLQSILSTKSNLSSEARWEEWMHLFISSNHYMPTPRRIVSDEPHAKSATRFIDDDDPSRIRYYTREELQDIKNIFNSQNSFASFAQAIYLLRSWTLNFDDGKGWIYKQLFPFGYETIFSELSVTARGRSEYLQHSSNYMSGCGEILFSMLQRACAIYTGDENTDENTNVAREPNQLDAKTSHDFALRLVNTFFPQNNPINDVAKALAGKRSEHEQAMQQALQQNLWSFDERWKQVKSITAPANGIKPDSSHLAKLINSHMLAVKQHATFKILAEDFNNVLKINLAVQDKFSALSTVGLLNIMVYLLRIGRHACALEQMQELAQQHQPNLNLGELKWLIEDNEYNAKSIAWRNIDMVVAIKATTRSRLRQMSAQSLRRNQSLIGDSLEPYTRAQARALIAMINPKLLHGPLSQQELIFCSDVLKVFFTCRIDINLLNSNQKDKHIAANSLDDILKILCQRIRENGSKTLDVHQSYARSVGLMPMLAPGNKSNSVTRSYYTLSDELIRHLVYALMGTKKHMLFDEFLEALYQRYQLIIGPNQATKYYSLDRRDPNFIERKEFTDNAEDFKEQLSRLDLLLSLSDGFDYVCNPYGS